MLTSTIKENQKFDKKNRKMKRKNLKMIFSSLALGTLVLVSSCEKE
jgi:hypothetical protein